MSFKKVPIQDEFPFQLNVKSRITAAALAELSPAKGDRYILTDGANINKIGTYNGSTWDYLISLEGFITWIDNENLFYKFDGSNWSQLIIYSRSFIITNPTSSSDGAIWRVPVAITITAIHYLCVDGTNIIGQLWEFDSNGLNGSTVDADTTATAGINVDNTTLDNPGIAAGNYLGWKMTSVSGAVTKFICTFDYTIN